MKIVIPVSYHDKDLVEDFCNAINFFGPYEKHTLLVVVRPSDKIHGIELFNKINKQFLDSNIHIFQEDGPLGWPQGPNFYWKSTIEYLIKTKNESSWFWMELDCTPVKNNWADLLEEEYITSGKKYLGNIQKSTISGESKHLVGVAIYPPDFHNICNSWKELNENSKAFDVFCEKETVPLSEDSKLMQHSFRTRNYDCTEEGIKGIVDSKIYNDNFDRPIDPQTVLVHGCNDGSLARIITNTYYTKTNNKIPVHLHIPKSAGTFIISQTYGIFKYWCRKKNKTEDMVILLVIHENNIVLSINACVPNYKDNKNFKLNYDKVVTDLYSFISELIKNNIQIFSITIKDHGFCFLRQKLIDLICNILNKKPLYYAVLRNVYDRNQSLYNYIKSDNSSHELTHGLYTSKNFIEHIKSSQIEDNWITRRLTGISNEKELTSEHFDDVCSILDDFKIKDIKHVEELLDEIFGECYSLTTKNIPNNDYFFFKNETKEDKINFLDLNEETQNIFLKKTEFDQKIYQRYCIK